MKIWRKTIFNAYIFLGMRLFLLTGAQEERVCDISGACDNELAGTKIEDPIDCHKYYICVTNSDGDVIISDSAVTCPTGYYFNEEQQDCFVEEFKCRNKCDNLFCTRSCDGLPDGTLIAYPNDCSKFIVCIEETDELVTSTCSSEIPYFNGTDCSSDPYSCCDICTPYCEVAFIEVEDPFDCYSFYICQTDDYIPENEHYACEPGEYFNATEGECVVSNGTTCYPICNNYTPTTLPSTNPPRISTLTSSETQATSKASVSPSANPNPPFTRFHTATTTRKQLPTFEPKRIKNDIFV